MNIYELIPISNLPEEGLRFFHTLSNWVEVSKTNKPEIKNWEKGYKALKDLTVIKAKKGENLLPPKEIPDNTIYLPSYSHGLFVLRHLRNAFCHNALTYDENSKQYRIEMSKQVKIAGRFSLAAIKDFVTAFVSN